MKDKLTIIRNIKSLLDKGKINSRDKKQVESALTYLNKYPKYCDEDFMKSTMMWFSSILKRKGGEFVETEKKSEK